MISLAQMDAFDSAQRTKARLAQSVEYETLNLRVVGSSPTSDVVQRGSASRFSIVSQNKTPSK